MRHSHHDILDACFSSRLYQLSECSGPCIQTFSSITSILAKLGAEEVHKGLVLCQSSESRQLLFFCWFYSPEFLYFFLELLFNVIPFFLVEDVHVLKANLITVDAREPVLKLLNAVRSIVFLCAFSSEIFDSDGLSHLVFLVAEGRCCKTLRVEFAEEIFVLG